jgi:hypothetical protein
MQTDLKITQPSNIFVAEDPAAQPLALMGSNGFERARLHVEAAHRHQDAYTASMVAAAKELVAERIAIIKAARGTPMPNEVNEKKRWMDYRGPEWALALKANGWTVQDAAYAMQWDIDLEAALRRREHKNEARAEQHENDKVLIQKNNSLGGAPYAGSPRPAAAALPKPKAVSARDLADEVVKIGNYVKRINVEDRALALEILVSAREALGDLA